MVADIESLYPADSQHHRTRQLGEQFAIEAFFGQWRMLPTEVLLIYRAKCFAHAAYEERGARGLNRLSPDNRTGQ